MNNGKESYTELLSKYRSKNAKLNYLGNVKKVGMTKLIEASKKLNKNYFTIDNTL